MRSAEETNAYEKSYAEFVAEVNAGNIERFFDSPSNREVLRNGMFALQKEYNLAWPELWHARIWSSIYVQNLARLESRPAPISRAEKEKILHWKDLKDGLSRPKPLTEEQQRELARQEKTERQSVIQTAMDSAVERVKDVAKQKSDWEDMVLRPLRYIPLGLAAFDRDATEAEMRAMPSPVLKCWMARRQAFVRDEALKAQQEKESLRVIRELGGTHEVRG